MHEKKRIRNNAYYKFALSNKTKFQASATTSSANEFVGISLLDVNGEKIADFFSEEPNDLGYQVLSEIYVLPAGTYYVW